MTPDTDTESVREAKEYLSEIGRDDLAAEFAEELDERAEAAERVVELKTTAKRAEEAGLGDDPAVEALRERAATLARGADLGADPEAPGRLAEDYGLDEDRLADLSEDVREALREDLAAVDELEASRAELAKRELRHRRESLSATLADAGVEAAELVADGAPAPQAELSAALAATEGDVDDSGSERVRVARLEDRKAELEAERDDAESTLLEISLDDRINDVEERLAALSEEA